jgi:hypothetical protein
VALISSIPGRLDPTISLEQKWLRPFLSLSSVAIIEAPTELCGSWQVITTLPGASGVQFRRPSKYLGLALVALAACSAKDPQAGKPNAPGQSSSVQSIKRRLSQIAGQANQAAPANIDANTRLDGARAGPGLKLTSMYTLLDPESEGINATTFETKLTPVVKKGSCENSELRPLIDQGVVVVLEYRGNDGKPIGTVSINRDTCTASK